MHAGDWLSLRPYYKVPVLCKKVLIVAYYTVVLLSALDTLSHCPSLRLPVINITGDHS